MKTHSEIIDALGGTGEVASLCDVTTGAVSQWRIEGIPKARLMYLKVIRPEVFKDEKQPATHKRTHIRRTADKGRRNDPKLDIQ